MESRSRWIVGTAITLILAIAAVYTLFQNNNKNRLENEAAATTIAINQTQVALDAEQVELARADNSAFATANAISAQQLIPAPADGTDYSPTATALAIQSTAIASTRTYIDEQKQQIDATQTAVVESRPTFTCTTEDYVPPPNASIVPIGSEICIPRGAIAWISSDPAAISIPGVYEEIYGQGFTFALFGPVKFTVSDVDPSKIRLDMRSETSLVGNYDGKSLNLVYHDGKVCEHANFDSSSCR